MAYDNPILNQRKATHGNFASVAAVAQELKECFHHGERWNRLSDQQKEALDMIATKLARILNGEPDFSEHWLDVKGYVDLVLATLPSPQLQPNPQPQPA